MNRDDYHSSSRTHRSSGGGSSSRSGRDHSSQSSRRHGRSPSPRRRSSPPRERRRRSSSPGPSRRESSKRDDKSVPSSFTKNRDDEKPDNRNVLDQMSKSFENGPLEVLYRSMKANLKIKVWTRNFKEVRGICTGYPLAFDKHWNLVMKDVDEVCLKPRKGKTPYLRHLKRGDSDTIPEMQPKVPKEKIKKEVIEETMETATTTTAPSDTAPSGTESATEAPKETGEKKKRKRKKNKGPNMHKRHVGQLFVRGDNIVMIAILAPVEEEAE